MRNAVREPAVAGLFYPGGAGELAGTVDSLLYEAAARCPLGADEHPDRLEAVIAPHAGYVYSGPTAAAAYTRVARLKGRIERVVLLGPVHRVPVRGLAHPGCEVFRTPLGDVPVEPVPQDVRDRLPQIVDSTAAHAQEHSLEVHVPFLQRVLGEFSLLPFAVGGVSADEVADVIAALDGGDETLVVASTDLSHYLPYDRARQVDSGTIQQILALDGTIPTERACGAYPTNGVLVHAARAGRSARLIEACNAGDTAGDRGRVVGYVSVSIERAPAEVDS